MLCAQCWAVCAVQVTRLELPTGEAAAPPCHSVPDDSESDHGAPCCGSGHLAVQSTQDTDLSGQLGLITIEKALPPSLTAELGPINQGYIQTCLLRPTASPPGTKTTVLRI